MSLSRTAERTRRDIVRAAIACWSRDSTASLTEVAREAQVGRTTLNRYFSSRDALIAEVGDIARRQMVEALTRADLARGPGLEAVVRAATGLLEISDILGLIFTDHPVVDPDTWDEPSDGSPIDMGGAIARGHDDGTIDPDLPVDWVETYLWTTVFAAQLTLAAGQPMHRVGRWLERSLTGGLGTAPAASGRSPR